jgi:CRP-like cAMP-binding protein
MFSSLSQEEQAAVINRATETKVRAGDKVVAVDSSASDFYFILSGSCQVTVSGDSKDVTVAILRSGDFVGEASLFDAATRNATVVARTEVELLHWRIPALHQLFEEQPNLGIKFYRGIAHMSWARLNEMNSLMRDAFQGIVEF